MIVGLLDPKWETRHGCSHGLMDLLNGLDMSFTLPLVNDSENDGNDLNTNLRSSSDVDLFKGNDRSDCVVDKLQKEKELPIDSNVKRSKAPSSSSSSSTSTPSSPTASPFSSLPKYLIEDIICTGLCLLMLDRFIDLGSSSSIIISPAKEVLIVKSIYCNVEYECCLY